MQRTQILLEEWQHHALRARAEREGRSMSDLVRELLSTSLARPAHSAKGLEAIEGIAEDRAVYGRDHDSALYGKPDRR